MNLPRDTDRHALEANSRKLEQNRLMLESIKKRVKRLAEELNQSTKETKNND